MQIVKEYIRIFTVIALSISYFHCGQVFQQGKQNSNDLLFLVLATQLTQPNCGPSGNGFWARNVQTNFSDCIARTLVSSGNHINIYLESGLSTSLDYESLANSFDTSIYPKLVNAFGESSDINGDGKIDLFILDIRDGAKPNEPFVAGFFDPVDFYPDNRRSAVRSNQREILYMDGKELVGLLKDDPQAFGSTLAHEFQHLIRFPHMQKLGVEDDVWINEGTSEVASDIGGFGPQTQRLKCLVGDIGSPCSGGANSVSLINWSSNTSGDRYYILKQYSYAYAFMRYLYDNAGLSELSKSEFLRQSVNGNFNNIRGNTAINLMTLLRESTGNTATNPSNPIGISSQDSFQILLNGFWGQMVPSSNLGSSTRSNSLPSSWDLSNLLTEFPLGATLGPFATASYPKRTSLPSQLPAGSAVFVQGDKSGSVSTLTTTTKLSSIPNSSDSILVYGESNKLDSVNIYFQVVEGKMASSTSLERFSEPIIQSKPNNWLRWQKDRADDPSNMTGEGAIPLCGHPFLAAR